MNADTPKLTETFDRYLEGQMSRRERIEFEARLKIDPDFADAFELHKEIDFILFQDELNFFRQELDKIIQQNDGPGRSAPMMLNRNENEDLEEAILDQDVMNLRNKLADIFADVEEEVANEEIPHLAPIERAVAEQDAVALHDELDKLNIDPDFAVAVGMSPEEVLSSEIDQAIRETDVIEFRSTLGNIAEELMPTKTRRVVAFQSPMIRAIAAAAMVILLVSSGWLISNQTGGIDDMVSRMDRVSDSDFGPGPARGGLDDESGNPWVDYAYDEFMGGEFEDAAKAYQIIEETSQAGAHTWIYQAKSLYQIKDYAEAMKYFEKVNADNNNVYLEEAQWYMAKCLVHLERQDDANPKLAEIINSDEHDYKAEARKLYKKISK